MKCMNDVNLETKFECMSGTYTLTDDYFKDTLTLMRERGRWPYEDGLYRMWVQCKVVDKFTKNKLFGGRKYYFVIQLVGNTKEFEVSEHNYYNNSEMDRIHMYSEDGKIWYPIRK
jgi:hypothetical protein